MMRWRRTARRRPAGPRANVPVKGARARVRRRWWGRIKTASTLLAGAVAIGGVVWGGHLASRHAGPALARMVEIKTVSVTGNDQVTRTELIDRLKLEPGASLVSVDTTRLAARLAAHPWVKEATVSRVLPHTLAVQVVERRPAAVLRSPSGSVLLDEEGRPLTLLSESNEPALPVLFGINPKRVTNGDAEWLTAARKGIELAALLSRTFDGRPEVDVSNPDNVVAYVQGLRLQFGTAEFEEKWNLYRKLEPHVAGAAGHGRSDGQSEIDLRYPGKVIVRERG